MSNPLAGIADVTDVVKNTVIAHPSDDDDVSAGRIMALLLAPRPCGSCCPTTPHDRRRRRAHAVGLGRERKLALGPASSAFVVEGQP